MLDTLLGSVTPSYIPATKPLTKSQTAAIHYLRGFSSADPREIPIGWDFLVGICYKAIQNLFTVDGFAEYSTPHGVENSVHTRRRDFVIQWLGEYSKPFKGLSGEELDLAIEISVDDFRWIGRKCRNAFLKIIRKCPVCDQRKVKQCLECEYLLTHRQMNTRGMTHCPECGVVLKGHHRLACNKGCQPLSVRTSLDTVYGEDSASKLSEYLVLDNPTPINQWLQEHRPDLERLGLYCGFQVFADMMLDGSGIRSVTRAWAQRSDVSLKGARGYIKQFRTALNIACDHKLVREFYRHIERVGDGPRLGLAVAESKQTKLARLARSEAARELAEFNRGLSAEAVKEGSEAVREVSRAIASADADEIESRKNPAIASSTWFRGTDGGLEQNRREAELDLLLQDCTLEELADDAGVELDSELTPEENRWKVLLAVTEFAAYGDTELEVDEQTGYDLVSPE